MHSFNTIPIGQRARHSVLKVEAVVCWLGKG